MTDVSPRLTFRRPVRSESGMALIITILVIALLTIVIVDRFHAAFIETALAASYRDETKAYFAARAGQAAARLILVEDKRASKIDTLGEEWAIPLSLPVEEDFSFITIVDESGKFDVNSLTSDKGYPQDRQIALFARLLTLLELDPSLVDSAIDWIDSDSLPTAAGAEANYYASLPTPYSPKNGPLDSVEELGQVKGFTAEVMAKLRPHITVWSGGKININTAGPMVLMALDERITENMVNAMMEQRLFTPFTSKQSIGAAPGMKEIYPDIALLIDVTSDFFLAETSATFDDTTRTIRAVYERTGGAVLCRFHKLL